MKQADYQTLAIRYASKSYPVIVADGALNSVYFNPAATANEVILVRKDFLLNAISPQKMQYVRLCHRHGTPQHFTQKLGREHKMLFAITVELQRPYIIFNLHPKEDKGQKKQNEQIALYQGGYENIMRSSLHQLLAMTELADRTNANQGLGAKGKLQVLKALRITRQMDFLSKERPCVVVDFPRLIHDLLQDLKPFLKEHFDKAVFLQSTTESACIKCNPVLMRCVLLNMISTALRQNNTDVFMRYDESPRDIMITISSVLDPKETEMGPPVDPAVSGIRISEELARRQQGRLLTRTMQNGKILYCLQMPRAQAENALRESLDRFLQHELSDVEIEFSDLI